MHTTLSDGALDPVEAINIYREAGYDFIAITDHRKVGHLWQDDSFLILPGVEWDTTFIMARLTRALRSEMQGQDCGSERGQAASAIILTRRRSSRRSGQRAESRSSRTLPGP